MQPYQSYLPTAYQQSTYQQNFNPQMPMQNPYMDRMSQLQQYQQNLQMQPAQMSGTGQQAPAGINGKVVMGAENIAANDVPMDGSVAFFPKQDMSEIYAKCWNSDGTIKTVIYKPFVDNPNNSPQTEEKLKIGLSDEVTGVFMNKFNELSEKIDRLEQSMTKPATKTGSARNKKEADAE